MEVCKSLVGGRPVAGAMPSIDKRYPATGEVIARIEPADQTILDQAVEVAAAAQREWGARSGSDRAAILQKAADGLRAHNDALSRLEVRDVGKSFAEAVSADVPSGADAMAFFASMAMTEAGDMHRYADAIAYCERVPLGVCAGIGAWNYPVQIACWKAAPALAAGNAFILKPSELTPLTAHLVAEILADAGLPEGLFQILHGDYQMGRAICAHPGIAKISLTGGVETGRLIMAQSAETLKKVTLELGGKSPLIVFADADFDLAVETALAANFYTAGEVCSNATRVYVEEAIAADFEAALIEGARALRVGDPMADDVQMGALISEPHLNKVLDYIAIGTAEGAKVATGGKRLHPQGFESGYFMEPTILTQCRDDMRVVREEIFGPVMSVLTFSDEQEAITRANATQFGLGAGLITRDLTRAHRVAGQLESGNVWVNTYNLLPPGLPFGGIKQSGFGRENSAYSLDAYSEIKTTYIQL
ncbi:MAG: betaine-aldehyde dehydrogenase [Pseudomonadota bacterium]|nr:betaine-aldehyde dehydrogenase [Pseudomonadota bacterium]HCI20033.1 betaine-aldehyde dehydrogenase [Alphaproteobacteria bacterium]|tara:strand:- start:693 stop:2123 length:1431 start_codon:yes stop_codon:yes gene_type:complete